MRSLVIGASTGIGRALAEELARAGHDLYLVASDQRDIAPLVSDLSLRFNVAASGEGADLAAFDAAALRRNCLAALGGLDGLFYIAGLCLIEQDPGDLEDSEVERLIDVNFTAGVRLVNAFLPELEGNPRANLVGIGSVAQARARARNTVYAAAKSGLEFYFSGLRLRLAGRGASVRFYRVGFADTQMTYGQSLALPKASPESIAAAIRAGLGRDDHPAYLPAWWSLVALVYRSIPWPIFKRMGAPKP